MQSKYLKLFLAVGLAVSSVFALARTEPNSFLNKPARTSNELVAEIQNDPQVMSRYTRHFGMTPTEVVSYFKTLHQDTLKEDGVYLVYNTPESNEIRARAMFYKKGTKVWVDQHDGIVLKASCGNPMSRGTDVQTVPTTVDLDTSPNLVSRITEMPMATSTVMDTSSTMIPTTVESSALAFPTAPPLQAVPISSGSFNPGILIPLAGIPFIIPHGHNPPNPVPEPASMIVFGGGALALAARKRFKKKN